jgi:hypothetical protein
MNLASEHSENIQLSSTGPRKGIKCFIKCVRSHRGCTKINRFGQNVQVDQMRAIIYAGIASLIIIMELHCAGEVKQK